MKLIILILCMILVVSAQTNKIIIDDDRDAIIYLGEELVNIRGMLEMYAQIGCAITYKLPNPKKKLKASLIELEGVLDALDSHYDTDPLITRCTQKARRFWVPVKQVIEKGILGKNINTDMLKVKTLFIHDNIRSTIKEISKMKAHLMKRCKIKHKKELNAVLEIAASLKRISAHYMMRVLQVDDPTIEAHYMRGLRICRESMKIMEVSRFAKNPKRSKNLIFLKKRLYYFEEVWNRKILVPSLVAKWSNDILEKVRIFARQIK